MVYDYTNVDLDPIEREEVEEIVNKFVAENSVQITNDLINAINNANMVQDVIQNLNRLDE